MCDASSFWRRTITYWRIKEGYYIFNELTNKNDSLQKCRINIFWMWTTFACYYKPLHVVSRREFLIKKMIMGIRLLKHGWHKLEEIFTINRGWYGFKKFIVHHSPQCLIIWLRGKGGFMVKYLLNSIALIIAWIFPLMGKI